MIFITTTYYNNDNHICLFSFSLERSHQKESTHPHAIYLCLSSLLNASSLWKRLTHECCINEGVNVSQSYVGKSVVSLLSIPTMGEGQDPTMSTTLQPKVVVGKV